MARNMLHVAGRDLTIFSALFFFLLLRSLERKTIALCVDRDISRVLFIATPTLPITFEKSCLHLVDQ